MSEKNIWYESEIEALKKEIALVREDAQVQILTLEKLVNARNSRIVDLTKISESHQRQNGELREKLSKYEDKAAHYRRKAIL